MLGSRTAPRRPRTDMADGFLQPQCGHGTTAGLFGDHSPEDRDLPPEWLLPQSYSPPVEGARLGRREQTTAERSICRCRLI